MHLLFLPNYPVFSDFYHFSVIDKWINKWIIKCHKTSEVICFFPAAARCAQCCSLLYFSSAFYYPNAVTYPFCLQVLPCSLFMKFSGFCCKQWKCEVLCTALLLRREISSNYLVLHLRNFASYFDELLTVKWTVSQSQSSCWQSSHLWDT